MGTCKIFNLTSKNDNNWWYGKYSDIIANAIGIGGALLLKKYIN